MGTRAGISIVEEVSAWDKRRVFMVRPCIEVCHSFFKTKERRNNGDDGKIPILIYGNGLFDYSLITEDGEETIWNSSDGYDIPIIGDNCELDIP